MVAADGAVGRRDNPYLLLASLSGGPCPASHGRIQEGAPTPCPLREPRCAPNSGSPAAMQSRLVSGTIRGQPSPGQARPAMREIVGRCHGADLGPAARPRGGLDLMLGGSRQRVSGGEARRVAHGLACFLRRPRIVLLGRADREARRRHCRGVTLAAITRASLPEGGDLADHASAGTWVRQRRILAIEKS